MTSRGPKLKAGRVVHIRVNPRDCLSCIDVAQKVSLVMKGMSFAQVVSIALSAGLETLRSAKLIPTRDGFEYAEMMAPFGPDKSARKVEITETFYLAGSDVRVPTVRAEPSEFEPSPISIPVQRLLRKINELESKRDVDPANWSPEEQRSLDELTLELATVINSEQGVEP